MPHRFSHGGLIFVFRFSFQCLGPTDSDWNNKSFRVTQRGCIGGRKQPALLAGKDFMQFSDATVSRRHFGIVFDKEVLNIVFKIQYGNGVEMCRVAWRYLVPLT